MRYIAKAISKMIRIAPDSSSLLLVRAIAADGGSDMIADTVIAGITEKERLEVHNTLHKV
jgi:hypothetical protein